MIATKQMEMDFSRMRYDGPAYDPAVDQRRLAGQTLRVWAVLRVGGWYTVPEISALTNDPETSVSAQIRHLRKPRFGGHDVEKRRRGGEKSGLWEFHLVKPLQGRTF